MSNLEVSTLHGIFDASFSPDPNVRIAAELELLKLQSLEGLIPTLLQLISPQATPTSPAVRLAAAIYLKNRVVSSWRTPANPLSYSIPIKSVPFTAIPPSDRLTLKINLLPLLAALAKEATATQVKLQVSFILTKVIEADYPDNWPSLGEEILATLRAGGEGEIEAGLRATVAVIRTIRYRRGEDEVSVLSILIEHLYPTLLSLGQQILEQNPTEAASLAQQGEFLHLILKAYKNSIQSSLLPILQASDSIIPWGTFFLSITQRALPINLLPEDLEDREKHSWSKAKKWAMYTLNRLFTRYGNPSQLPSNMKESYGPFANVFVSQFTPEIMRSYLGLVERIVGGEWAASKTKHHMLAFFEECIKPAATWSLLKPHVQALLENFVFPLICLSEEEIELYTDDPQEFARTHFGDYIEDSYNNPCATSLAFVASLVELRKKASLMPMLMFIQTVVSKYPGATAPREKDGALRMLVSLADTATKTKKLAPMMESFFQLHVLPEFKSEHGFLRYRACHVVEKFESCDMTWEVKENIELMASAVMGAVTDPDLPVRVQAAITLPELARYEKVRAVMVPNIGPIMQEILKLGDEVDLDALTNTTRALVAEFSEEVLPFAVELTQSLSASYTRLIQEMIEGREKEDTGGYDNSYEDEKTMVCMSILKTLDGLITSLDGSPVALDNVELIVAPVLEFTVRNNLVELFDEVFEILDSLSFFQKKISPCMWPLFEATYHSFKNGSADYFNEMYGCIDNFIAFGSEGLAVNPEYRRMMIDMFDTVMTSRDLGAEDRNTACKLGEALLLHLRGQIDEAIPVIIERAMTCVLSKNDDEIFAVTPSLYLHSLELVITCFFYNTSLSLSILAQSQHPTWTQEFFTAWFKNLAKYSRVHDIRICVGAICEIFEWLAANSEKPEGALLLAGSSQLIVAALKLFKIFPEAMRSRKEMEKDIADGDDEEDGDEDEEYDDDDAEDYEEGDLLDKNNEYMEMISKSQDAIDHENDDLSDAGSNWSEEVLWTNPLDHIDLYTRFTATMTAMEVANPALFQLATTPLVLEQRTELEAVAKRALQGGEANLIVLTPAGHLISELQ